MEIKFKAKHKDGYTLIKSFGLENVKPQSDIISLEQYIGLKDKNGNELYLNDDFKYKHAKLTVDFKNGAFGYNYAGMFLSFCLLIDEGDFTIIDNCIQEIEVIDD